MEQSGFAVRNPGCGREATRATCGEEASFLFIHKVIPRAHLCKHQITLLKITRNAILFFQYLNFYKFALKIMLKKQLQISLLQMTFSSKNIAYKVLGKTITLIQKPVTITMQKCYYPGPNKKVIEIVGKEGPKVIEKCVGTGCKELSSNITKVTSVENKQPTYIKDHGPNIETHESISSEHQGFSQSDIKKIQQPRRWLSNNNKPNENQAPVVTKKHTQEMISNIKKETQVESDLKKKINDNATSDILKIFSKKESTPVPTTNTTTLTDFPEKHLTYTPLVQDPIGLPLHITDAIVPYIPTVDIPELVNPVEFDHENNSYKIPTPPPLPLISPTQEIKKTYSNVLDEILGLGKNKIDNSNIKPRILLKSISGKIYTTNINQDTTINNVTDEVLKIELLKREIIKENGGNTATVVKIEGNTEAIVGNAKNGIKLTQVGQAYYSKLKTKKQLNESSMIPNVNVNLDANPEISFSIIVPPKVADDVFIEDGKQKHLLVVFDTTTNNYYSIGYMTSKSSGDLLSDKQYKYFENEQDHKVNPLKQKQQFFVPSKHPVFVPEDQIKVVKYSKEYLDSLGFEAYENLLEAVKILKEIPPVAYSTLGLTTSDALDICKEYDLNELKKKKHPLTEDQIKLNNINKQKQKEGNINIKQDKNKTNENENII